MRLIKIDTLELVDFPGGAVPPYVILSHRWMDDEVSFKEYRKGLRTQSKGHRKITEFCAAVKKIFANKIQHVWVDTVCIDKRSSAELTESINSMWKYYQRAKACFTYMSDVTKVDQDGVTVSGPWSSMSDRSKNQFKMSSWWNRGWTLQELLAPSQVLFFDRSWQLIGGKTGKWPVKNASNDKQELKDLGRVIGSITNIPVDVLQGKVVPQSCSIAQRISWASGRQTTRLEDEAYSLLGLLKINMPLLYGEGMKAFQRLQMEIIKISHDQSVFAWSTSTTACLSILATSALEFKHAWDVVRKPHNIAPYTVTNHGLELRSRYQTLYSREDKSVGHVHTCLVPMDFFSRGLSEDRDRICYFMLTRLGCRHYSRILTNFHIYGRRRHLSEEGTLYVHIQDCEDPDRSKTSLVDHDLFWRKREGKAILEKQQLSLVPLVKTQVRSPNKPPA